MGTTTAQPASCRRHNPRGGDSLPDRNFLGWRCVGCCVVEPQEILRANLLRHVRHSAAGGCCCTGKRLAGCDGRLLDGPAIEPPDNDDWRTRYRRTDGRLCALCGDVRCRAPVVTESELPGSRNCNPTRAGVGSACRGCVGRSRAHALRRGTRMAGVLRSRQLSAAGSGGSRSGYRLYSSYRGVDVAVRCGRQTHAPMDTADGAIGRPCNRHGPSAARYEPRPRARSLGRFGHRDRFADAGCLRIRSTVRHYTHAGRCRSNGDSRPDTRRPAPCISRCAAGHGTRHRSDRHDFVVVVHRVAT